ncbi:MAG: hypothetical protein AB1489_26160 [Acidobacteriota bacterium]
MLFSRINYRLAIVISLLFLNILLLLTSLSVTTQAQRRAAGGSEDSRLRPPDKIKCKRDDLTSFTGRVLSFKRYQGYTILKMRTDEKTQEKFTLRHPNTDDPKEFFLLRGETFQPQHWTLIEIGKNRLRPNMRATVWVCLDGNAPIVDWQPPTTN